MPLINEKENKEWLNNVNELKALNNKEIVKEGVNTRIFIYFIK